MVTETLALILVSIGALVFLAATLSLWRKTKHYESKYSGIIDIEGEIKATKDAKQQIEKDTGELRESYKQKKKIFDDLVKQAAIYDESIELSELGFYKPHFDFDSSEEYKDQINSVKLEQKEMIRGKTAITCNTEWTVSGSRAKGRTMTNRAIRITARAFNNECDAAIAKVRWNNAERVQLRVEKAFDAINKLNASSEVAISRAYLDLKLKELQLTHEYHEKKQEEKEEERAIRQEMREAAKLEQDLEQAVKEEDRYDRLLAKARAEAEKASGSRLAALQEKIDNLKIDLEVAHSKSERAKSMAEQTKAGHVYIVSNVGSFGAGVHKIGMTRRLEPLDRIKELGDASVPFTFDMHAMIYSEDAPALERTLHKAFDDRRLNVDNSRKEFFRVELPEIKALVLENHPGAKFYDDVEAREFRETEALLAQREHRQTVADARSSFPDEI